MTTPKTQKSWSEDVAAIGVDMLVDHGFIRKEDFDRATQIVAEEILCASAWAIIHQQRSRPMLPNHAFQRTAASHHGPNRRVSWPSSLSLCR